MGPDAANILGPAAKSLDIDRSPNSSQRANDVSQDQLAGESLRAMRRKRPDAAGQVLRDRIRRERERRRREYERRALDPRPRGPDSSGDTALDVVV